MFRPRRARLFGAMFITGLAAVYNVVMALVVDDGELVRYLYAVIALGGGWASGFFLGTYQIFRWYTVTRKEEDEDALAPSDREAVLTRVDRRLAAYPNLWPSAVPIIAVVVTVLSGAFLTLLRFVLASDP